jgi:biopolymer transport protein ExbD
MKRHARTLLLLFIVTAAVFLAYCVQQGQPKTKQAQSSQVVAVHVTANGVIVLNGRQVTLEQLKQEFARLAAAGGAVQYSRDNPTADPPPIAMEVLRAIVAAKLPVEMVQR